MSGYLKRTSAVYGCPQRPVMLQPGLMATGAASHNSLLIPA